MVPSSSLMASCGVPCRRLSARLIVSPPTEATLICGRGQLLKSQPPYSLRAKLADAKWVMQTTDDLKAQIEAQHKVADAYDERYEALKGGAR